MPKSAFDSRITQKARAILRDELGTDDLKGVKKTLEDAEAARKEKMTETQKLTAERDEFKKKAEASQEAADAAQFRADMTLAAIAAGANPAYVDDVIRNLADDINNGRYTEEELEKLDYAQVMTEYKQKKPAYFIQAPAPRAGGPPSPTTPTPPTPPPQVDVTKMSDAEWEAYKRENPSLGIPS